MMSYFKVCLILVMLGLGLSLYACKQSDKTFRVGVVPGPHAIIMEEVKKIADQEGFPIEVIEFNDFNLPNAALAQGEVNVNVYQHEPFLTEQMKNRGYDFVIAGKAITLPFGLYSNKLKNFSSINAEHVKPGAKIAIPNDPTNEGRALRLLELAKLIKLKPVENPTPLDIVENPLKFKFLEVEAPQLPRILDDVSFAVINTDWVVLAGIDPRRALFHDEAPKEYTNIIVARRQDAHDPRVERFVKIYQSHKVKKFIEDRFKGTVQPAW